MKRVFQNHRQTKESQYVGSFWRTSISSIKLSTNKKLGESTAKRILERLGIESSSSFVKILKAVFLILKPISCFSDMAWFFT